ncbi:CocE/NonD family hydrolase [Chryseobacterium sp. MEBOG06]|uniref:CocE/NonD family hydrolase n=1 Tax=unclassified Chryseobacterium TaxID=2593645 RepID=UPI001EFFE2CA|nr:MULTISPECIES: CocE/NonD family hydrolase [unclassified Chryseobacterium]UKB84604.1 CocE/NonD family hydrolase [Chryseobacterium sp. MEBOG06]
MSKRKWCLFFLFFLFYCSSQKLYFKKIELENPDFENRLLLLNKDLIRSYKEKDSLKYQDNYFRLQMLDKDYNGAIKTIYSIRNNYKNSYPYYSKIIGIQFELYLLVKNATKATDIESAYENILRERYNQLPIQSRYLIPDSFKFKKGFNKNEVIKILRDSIKNDSISLKNAVLLCRNYNTHITIEKTFSIAERVLKKLDKENFLVKDSIIVKTEKDKEISLYYVLNKKIEQPLPTILHFSVYSRNSDSHILQSKISADKGYNIVNASSRGVSMSNGTIIPFEFEINDVNQVIDWIIKQPWSNGKVGMLGGSYDGFSQWAATKNLHPALKTIIPSASVGFGIDFPMFNNSYSPYMLRWLSYVKKETDYKLFSDEKEWLSVYNSYYKSGIAFNKLDSMYGGQNPIFQEWLKHPSFDVFWRSKMPYKKDFSKINIPVLTFTGYYDADQRGAMYYFNEHYKYNKNANHYLVMGPYSHAGVVSGVSENYKGYMIDPVANIDIEDLSYQWFDYILKGSKKPEFLKDKVNFQIMGSNRWMSAPSLDKITSRKLKLFFNKTTLQELKPEPGFIAQKIDFLEREDTLKSLDSEKILDNAIDETFIKYKLIFESDAFDKPTEIIGNFTGELKASINKKDMDITMEFYEKLHNGQYLKLCHDYFARVSYAKDNTKRRLLKPFVKESIPIHNTFSTGRKIEKGSKLILVLGIRKSADAQINYGTGKDVSSETIADAKEPLDIKWYTDSYIEVSVLK